MDIDRFDTTFNMTDKKHKWDVYQEHKEEYYKLNRDLYMSNLMTLYYNYSYLHCITKLNLQYSDYKNTINISIIVDQPERYAVNFPLVILEEDFKYKEIILTLDECYEYIYDTAIIMEDTIELIKRYHNISDNMFYNHIENKCGMMLSCEQYNKMVCRIFGIMIKETKELLKFFISINPDSMKDQSY